MDGESQRLWVAAMVTTTTARPLHRYRSPGNDLRRHLSRDPVSKQVHRRQRHAQAGHDRIAEITDGTSNTIAIGEDAGRDPRYLSPYTQDVYNGGNPPDHDAQPIWPWHNPLDPGPAGGYTPYRRFWRWAEPDEWLRRLRHSQQQVSPRPRR